MANLYIPINGKASVKDAVVQILGQEWPLSAKSIYAIVKKAVPVTYQGVHKALTELVSQEALIKTGKRQYHLNLKWIKQIKDVGTHLERRYESAALEEPRVVAKLPLGLASKDSFTKKELVADNISSVIISKSTLRELIKLLDGKKLDALAKSIAKKDYGRIETSLPSDLQGKNKLGVFLDKLNELATDFYWGDMTHEIKGAGVEMIVRSDCFVSEKEKKFYDQIYIYFMGIFGYKLAKKDTLTGIMFFKPRK